MEESKNKTENNTGVPFSLMSPAQEREWIREANITYGGLIGLGIIMIQPFMYEGKYVGTPAKICVISFAVSTPILAALLLLNRQEDFKKHMTKSLTVAFSRSLAQLAAVAGFVARLWHISPLAGKVAIASCIFAMSAHSAGFVKLYTSRAKK